MSLNKKLIPDLLLVGINQVIDRTTAATTFVLQGVRAIFDPSNPQNTELYYRDDAGGEHYFPSSEKLADPSAGDDIGVNVPGIAATKLNPALAEIDAKAISVPGNNGEILTSDGSGGVTALGGPNKFAYDSGLGYVDSPFTPLGASGLIAHNGFIYLDKGNAVDNELQFRDAANTAFGKIIGSSSSGNLLISVFNKTIIATPLEILSSVTLSPAQISDPGTNTNKVMLVMDFTTGALERRPIATGSPSQGSQYVINVSDGSGGWQALDGVSLPLFQLNSVTGYLEFTGASGFITNVLEATSQVNISNDAGGLYFRDSTQAAMLDLSVQKDQYGAGLHQLDLTGAHRFDIGCEININTVDPGTDTGRKMLVIDTATNKVEERPLPSGGTPSQGISGVINIADGSGGWLPMDGISRPALIWDSATGDLSFTGGNFFISDVVKSRNNVDVVNNAGEIRFRDSTDSTTLGRFYIIKDSLAPGQHEIALADATRITIPFQLNAVDVIFMPNIFDPGTNTGKHIVITDDATGKVEKRPFSAIGGLPSNFIICTTAADVLAALALAQDYKTIFIQETAAATVTPSATNTPIDVYGQNVILGSVSALTFSTIIPTNTLQFQRTSGGFTSIRVSGLLLSLLPGNIGPVNIVDLDNVQIIADNLSTPPWGYTVNGAGGALYWKNLTETEVPIAGTAIAQQAFTNTWGLTNTFSVETEADFIRFLQIDLPVKNLHIAVSNIALSSNTITDIKGQINVYGNDLTISISAPGTLSLESASTPIKNINFFISRVTLANVTTLNLENVSFRARTLVNSPPGTTNVTSTVTGTGSVSYENPDLTGAINFTGAATQTFWDNTLIDAFGRLPAVDGSNLTNVTALDNTKLAILNNLSDLNSPSLARTNLGLGSSAVADTGTGPGNVVQLDGSSRLPAVDGSQLTNLPGVLNVVSFTNPATLTPDASTTKQINANAQAQALTVNVPTNPTDGAKVIYRIRAASTSTVTWSASFVDLKGNLPTSAPINKTIVVGAMYNAFISVWEVVSVVEQT